MKLARTILGTLCIGFSLVAQVPEVLRVETGRSGSTATALGHPTWAEHVAPIIYRHCAECHRSGQGAPFDLVTYEDVSKRSKMIKVVTESKTMPPWHPDPKVQSFRDARILTPAEALVLAAWSDAGAPAGDIQKAPPAPKYPADGWRLGTPDLVVTMPQPFNVPATGPDIYRAFVLPLALNEDRYVRAVEMRSTAPTVVHHVLYFLDSTGAARKRKSRDKQPGFPGIGVRGFTGGLGGWAVGATPAFLPDGLALELPKGSDLILQTHFHPSGVAESASLTIGLYFAKAKPEKKLFAFQSPRLFGALAGLVIPAGKKDHAIKGSFVVPVDVDLVGVGGHAHYLAHTMEAVAEAPDGTKTPLFRINDWDFNWQGQYEYAKPIRVKAGTRIRATITYDNSSENPSNPHNPPKRVRFGEETTDEMGSITFRCVAVHVKDEPLLDEVIRSELAGSSLGGSDQRPEGLRDPKQLMDRFKQLDSNHDGFLEIGEWPEDFGIITDFIDADQDGRLSLEEIRNLSNLRGRRRGN